MNVTANPSSGPFALAHEASNWHLIVQPADARLNPPESYFFVSDGIIIACGVLYALCYFFYMTRTVRDKKTAGSIEYLCTCMAYESFYATVIPSTSFERACFFVWFLFDVAFTAVAIKTAYPPERRRGVLVRMVVGFGLCLAFLKWLTQQFPDEREQVTAFWTGVALQFPISVGSVVLMIWERDVRGHSLEIWITRYLGCYTAYGLFFWRYWNIPENWAYVASWPSVWGIGLTLLAETIYPFVYLWVIGRQKREALAKTKSA
ncbi:hypothetical protein MBLNU230_g3001t1 [Neophaeotheca triangularis]